MNDVVNPTSDRPALLGGTPVVDTPVREWPVLDDGLRTTFGHLATSTEWAKYDSSFCKQLCDELCSRLELPHAVLVASGTAGIELALRSLKISPGDEVIMSAYDFKANFTNITLLRAKPVLVDINRNGQIDWSAITSAHSSATKAILVSHLHGGLVEMESLSHLARSLKLAIIEDCCQISPAASVSGHPPGHFTDVAVFSFGGTKLLSAGRGGAVVTRHDHVRQRIRLYTARGNEAYPLSGIQAAVLLPQLEQLPARHADRAHAVQAICQHPMPDDLLVPLENPDFRNADYYKLGFWYQGEGQLQLSRAIFCDAMQAEGIPLAPGFSALHRIHAQSRFRAAHSLANCDRAANQLAVLHHTHLQHGVAAAQLLSQAMHKIRRHAAELRHRFETQGDKD